MAIRQVGLLSRRTRVGRIDQGRQMSGRSLPVSAAATGRMRPVLGGRSGRCRSMARPFVASHDCPFPARPENPVSRPIFLNLPVNDLARATAFYQAVGAALNPQFSDASGSCMVFSDTIHVMLLTHDKFQQFTPKRIVDAREGSEVLICISVDSRSAVDRMVEQAIAAGGREPRAPQDHGFMYGRSFEDVDGHIWEPMCMDMEAANAAIATAQSNTSL